MAPRQQLKKLEKRNSAWLYSVVFTSKASMCAVLFLLFSFLIQPIHQAFAADEEVTEVTTSNAIAQDVAEQEVEAEPIEEVVEETETPANEEVVEDSNEDIVDETVIEQVPADTEEVTDSETSDTEDTLSTTEEVVDESEENGGGNDSDDSSTTTDEVINNERDSDTSSSTDETKNASDEEVVEESVTNEEPAVGEVNELQTLVTDENYYRFSKKACVPVGDGTYHCTSKDSSLYDSSSVVYAERGSSGNMEIFLKTSRGTTEQITDNNFDDTAPHYDAESKQIVWQRLINGRYQIIAYSIDEQEERQLTFSRTNNMEPKVSEAGIVWQAWDNNDWEIMFFDGEFTEQITDNDLQDVTPAVQDGYVVWSIIGGEEQEAKVYSIESKEILTISGYEGGTIANPRFVLVYDTKFENGDIVTQGFDPETGLSKPIAAQPAQDPIDLPHTDPTGEIRALIQKSADDEDYSIDQGNPDTKSGTSTTLDLGGVKTTISSTTLDLSGVSPSDISFDTTPIISKKIQLTDFDLVITGSSTKGEVDELSLDEIE